MTETPNFDSPDTTCREMAKSVTISHSGLDSLSEALAWLVQTIDTEFVDTKHLRFSVETEDVFDEETEEIERLWQASVSGMTTYGKLLHTHD